MHSPLKTTALVALAALSLQASHTAHAQDDSRAVPPQSVAPGQSGKRTLSFVNADIEAVLKHFMDMRGENYMIPDSQNFKEKITIVSNKPVSPSAAWQAFVSALKATGYSLEKPPGRSFYTIIKATDGQTAALPVGVGGEKIPYSDQVITQILPLDNVAVSDVTSVVNALKSKNGNVIAYNPTNTLIITDHAYNVRKVWQVITELDVGSPKSKMEIIQLQYADAAQMQTLIEQLYGSASSSTAPPENESRASRRRRRRRQEKEAEAKSSQVGVTAGKEAKYIDKVIADERTNSLIVLANEEGIQAVQDLLARIDVDATGKNRSQIHVVRLEQAKAQDVMDVLSRLSEGSNSSSSSSRTPTRRTSNSRTQPSRGNSRAQAGGEEDFGAIAAFDSGMRIAHDEATNSLVIIANPEDFSVVKKVIDELDRVRKQVYVDAVIMEISSDDTSDFGFGVNGPIGPAANPDTFDPESDFLGAISGTLGRTSALGLSLEQLSGLALGIFGPSIPVANPAAGLSDTVPDTIDVPAFGIALQAIKTYSGAEVVSNPQVISLDNEEAKIVVGRKIPFPSGGFRGGGGVGGATQGFLPTITFTREDVAVSLELTPRINSENYVTLEVRVEVSEVEPSDTEQDPLTSGGPVTSKREIETTTLVKDNQTVVLGGLIGTTETEVETKIPVLGDLPLIGALFRGRKMEARKSNLLVFLTPHIIESPDDMEEIQRVKEAQNAEFRRRFYGKSRDEAYEEVQNLMKYSMNIVDQKSLYRGSQESTTNVTNLSTGTNGAVELGRNGDDPVDFGLLPDQPLSETPTNPTPADLAPADEAPSDEGEPAEEPTEPTEER